MEFEGTILTIWPEEEVWANNLRKLTFVVEENSDREYKSSMAVELYKDKVDLIKSLSEWDKVKVWLNFKAREYNGRWFTNISAWRIDKIDGWSTPTSNTAPAKSADDDLPF